MVSGLEGLHSILRDKTRRKIMQLLDEQGGLSYTDLMGALGICSTGQLNYHLKVLSALVAKDEGGRYTLTEKGKLALRLLKEFDEEKPKSKIQPVFSKGMLVFESLFAVVLLIGTFALFFSGGITLGIFMLFLLTSIGAIVFMFLTDPLRKKVTRLPPQRQMLGAELSIIFAGSLVGVIILFFGGGLILVGLAYVGLHFHFESFTQWMVLSSAVGAVAGGFGGYWVFKRSKFSRITYYDPFAA
jgi:hypothetical protein